MAFGIVPLTIKRAPCLNSVLIANAVIKICHLNQKRHTSVHSNAHFASIAWPNGLTASVRTAEGSWCDVQYAPKHPSCVTLHPVSVTIDSRDENYVRSLLITAFVILLAVRCVPVADIVNIGLYWLTGSKSLAGQLFYNILIIRAYFKRVWWGWRRAK